MTATDPKTIDPATLVLVLGALTGALTGVPVVGTATGAAVGAVTGATDDMTRVRILLGEVFLLRQLTRDCNARGLRSKSTV
jgi:hypothetical protein